MSNIYVEQARLLNRLTRDTVAQMPDDKMEWAPVEGAHAFSFIVRHMCQGRAVFGAVMAGKPGFDAETITPEAYRTKAQLLDLVEKTGAAWIEGLTAVADRLTLELTGPRGFTLRGEEWAMTSVTHESEHRGNLVVHVRMNGGQPPDFQKTMQELRQAAAR